MMSEYLMEAEVILDGVRAEEDASFRRDHHHKAVQRLQREQTLLLHHAVILFTEVSETK